MYFYSVIDINLFVGQGRYEIEIFNPPSWHVGEGLSNSGKIEHLHSV